MLEKKDNPANILITAALLETPVLLLGFYLFWRSGNLLWMLGAMAIGTAIIVPAVLKFKRALAPRDKDPFDASR